MTPSRQPTARAFNAGQSHRFHEKRTKQLQKQKRADLSETWTTFYGVQSMKYVDRPTIGISIYRLHKLN
ncbi:hypothetical protein LTR37_010377 [Vermiconidia calcicola]|uniref:Uncharacterized protein n=1 Tax=Vermiconidia calcicola TaxID=1690605 RepID=A0ACC3N6S0_9PEZI|nr:hypothetical protein LTR37_010377 [Vermiconidia calcicola]